MVTYLAQLPVEPPTSAPAPQVAAISFLFHSPLPPPTPVPDAAPPTTAVQVAGEQGDEAWYRSPVSLTFAISDDFGAGYTEYKFDNTADWSEREYYYPTVVLAEEGTHTFEYRSLDTIRNAEAPQTTQIRIDRTPPQVNEPALDGSPLPNGWYNQPVSIQFSGADALSGVAGVERLGDNAAWSLTEPGTTVATTGQHTLAWRLVDKAGNHSSDQALNQEAVQSLRAELDFTPPALAVTANQEEPAAGWYRETIMLAASASDAQAGVACLDYNLDESGWQAYSTAAVPGGGLHQLRFRAIDEAGNAATSETFTLGVDTQPPTTTLHLSTAPNAAGWLRAPVTVTLAAVDAETGVFQTQYQWQQQSSPAIYQAPLRLDQEGSQTLTWFSLDRALNQEQPHSQTLLLDTTPPALTYTLSGDTVVAGWYRTAATLEIQATDALAGVAQIEYAVDGVAWQLYTAPVMLEGSGEHTVQLRAQDLAGNLSTETMVKVGIDMQPPRSTVALAGGRAANGWYVTPVTVTLVTTDTGTGVADTQVRLNGGLWQPYTEPLLVDTERVHLLEYQARDQAGNQETAPYIVFSIDLAAPSSQAAVLYGDSGRDGWYLSPVTLTLQGDDDESGLGYIEYQIDGQGWQPSTAAIEIAGEGIHQVAYRAVDASGRLEATQTLTAALDLTPLQIQVTFPEQLVYADLSVSEHYTVTDSVSGIVITTVLLNGEPYQPGQSLRLGENVVEIMAFNGAGLQAQATYKIVVTGGGLYFPAILGTQVYLPVIQQR